MDQYGKVKSGSLKLKGEKKHKKHKKSKKSKKHKKRSRVSWMLRSTEGSNY